MKYYVVSDVHGFYTQLIKALTDAGFFAFGAKYLSCNQPIVIIGDSLYIEGRILAIYTAQDPTLHKIQPQRRKNVQFFSNFFVKSIDF